MSAVCKDGEQAKCQGARFPKDARCSVPLSSILDGRDAETAWQRSCGKSCLWRTKKPTGLVWKRFSGIMPMWRPGSFGLAANMSQHDRSSQPGFRCLPGTSFCPDTTFPLAQGRQAKTLGIERGFPRVRRVPSQFASNQENFARLALYFTSSAFNSDKRPRSGRAPCALFRLAPLAPYLG
jgi:hypothetical protein